MSATAGSSAPDDVRVFRVARGWRIFMTVVGGGLAVFFGSVPFWGFDQVANEGAFFALTIFLVGWAVLFATGVVAAHKERVEIHSDRVRRVGVFRTRDLLLTDVAGFRLVRTSPPSVLLISKAPPPRRLPLDLVMERKPEFLEWLTHNFPDLEAVEAETEIATVRADSTLGATEQGRLAALQRARRVMGWFNFLAIAGTLWGIIAPRPYGWSMGLLAVLPVLAFVLLHVFRRLVLFDGNESARPNVAYGLIVPGLVLALRAFLDWNILDRSNLLVSSIVVGGAMTALLLIIAPESRRHRVTSFLCSAFFFAYGHGLIVHLNCYHDHSAPTAFPTTVIAASASSGNSPTYHLTVQPWVDSTEPREVTVSKRVHDRHSVGSTAEIVVRRGRLHGRWYYLR